MFIAVFIVAFNMWVLHFTYYIHIIWDYYIRVAAIYRFQHIPWYENWCLLSYPVSAVMNSTNVVLLKIWIFQAYVNFHISQDIIFCVIITKRGLKHFCFDSFKGYCN